MSNTAYSIAIKDMMDSGIKVLVRTEVDPFSGNYKYLNKLLGIHNGNQGKVAGHRIVTDSYGNEWITKDNFPNLVKQWKSFVSWAYWNSGCIDEAMDWCNEPVDKIDVSTFTSEYVQMRWMTWHGLGCPIR